MTVSFQIEIPRRSRHCRLKQEPFTPGMRYHSVLAEAEEGDLQRQDYCSQCWEAVAQGPEKHGQSHWIGRVPHDKEEKEENLDRDERALVLLKEALQSDSDAAHDEAFVLALYLERRRLLARRKETIQQGYKFLLYEVLATEEMLAVKLIDLSKLSVAGLQRKISRKLNGQDVSSETSCDVQEHTQEVGEELHDAQETPVLLNTANDPLNHCDDSS